MPIQHSRSAAFALTVALLLVVFPTVAHCFGAGNIQSIAKVEGVNWRHGDIEDTLLNLFMARVAKGKKFSKMDVKRVYFGNWLRDYSQAVDVGTVKHVSAEAIRIILWVLGFMSFGYGTKEFEVTKERLGVYRPEEHIDNPKDYADNLDAREFDPRLRGPVDEKRELSIDLRSGMKMYIASEDQGITTSAGLIRDVLGRSIRLGRQYANTKDKADLYEALRLLGTGCHCLEDFSAHSNYCELSLRQMGNSDVFPHVGARTQVRVQGVANPVFPIVTGTFGGVDFLHSVMGEFSDKITQSEINELEGTIESSEDNQNTNHMKKLLKQMPSGLLGGDMAARTDELEAQATATRMENLDISSKDPEALTLQLNEASKKIYPVLEFHDNIFKAIEKAVSRIPVLPALLEQLQAQINIFVFSLLAPVILPIIKQVKSQLETGSSAVIASSREKQHIVFTDDSCTDPTHSMLSKDHFSNVLNEPAGKVASAVLTWAVPQIMACWDDERIDVNRTLSRIIHGVFHHPALRGFGEDGAGDCRRLMFQTMEKWWHEKTEDERVKLRDQLSRPGVKDGRNHKDGVHDTGHGCGGNISQSDTATGVSSGMPPASSGGTSTPTPNPTPAMHIGGPHPPPSLHEQAQNPGSAIGATAAGVAAGGLAAGALAAGGKPTVSEQHHSASQSSHPASNSPHKPPSRPPSGSYPSQGGSHLSHEQYYDPPTGPPPGYSGAPYGGPPQQLNSQAQPQPPPSSQSQYAHGQLQHGYPIQPPYDQPQNQPSAPYVQGLPQFPPQGPPMQAQYGAEPYANRPPYGQPPHGQTPYGEIPYGQASPDGLGQYGSPAPIHEQAPYGQGQSYSSGPYGQAPYGGPPPYPVPGHGYQPYPPPGPNHPPAPYGQQEPPPPPVSAYGANHGPQAHELSSAPSFNQGTRRSRHEGPAPPPQAGLPQQFSHSPSQSHSPRRHYRHDEDDLDEDDEDGCQRRYAEQGRTKHRRRGEDEDEYSRPGGTGSGLDDYGSVGRHHNAPPPPIEQGYSGYGGELEHERPSHHQHHHSRHNHSSRPDEGELLNDAEPEEYGRHRPHARPYDSSGRSQGYGRSGGNGADDDDVVEDEYGRGGVGDYGYVHRRY